MVPSVLQLCTNASAWWWHLYRQRIPSWRELFAPGASREITFLEIAEDRGCKRVSVLRQWLSFPLHRVASTSPLAFPSSTLFTFAIWSWTRLCSIISLPGTWDPSFPSSLTLPPPVLLGFMCPLDWATECPDTGHLLNRVCLWGCFWPRWAFESINWVKQITFPNVSEPHPINCGLDWNRKDWVGRDALCLAAGSGPPLSFWEENRGSSGISSLLGLELEFTASVLLILGPSELDWNYILALLVLQQGDSRSGDFPVSIITWASSLQYVCMYIYIYILLVLFLWRTLTNTPSIQPTHLSPSPVYLSNPSSSLTCIPTESPHGSLWSVER